MGKTYTAQEIEEFEQFMADPGRRQAFATVKRRYDHVVSAVFSLPWAILPAAMETIATVLVEHLSGDRPTAQEVAERIEAANQRTTSAPVGGGVAVIPVHGPIMPRGGMAELSGATPITRLREQFRGAMAAKEVKGIILDIDSPGGSVFGVPEMASEIRAARGRKPVVAAIDGLGASAAFWLASQADEVVITPSSLTGSIGVVSAHEDVSEAAAQKGLKVTLISAGKHKVDGNPTQPLSEEARAHTQALVDDYYAMFTSDVAKGRRVPVDEVRNGMGEGRVVNARMAVSMGMVDRVASLEDVAGEMLSGPRAEGELEPVYAYGSDAPVGFIETDAVVPAGFVEEFADAAYPVVETVGNTLYVDAYDDAHFSAVDESAWDGNRAMGQCSSASDYRSICAGEHNAGEPDQRQHWALPHHYLGREANRAGVNAAASRLPQTQDLKNRAAAEAHIKRHQSAMESTSSDATVEALEARFALMRAARTSE